jgi:hypothetical protein
MYKILGAFLYIIVMLLSFVGTTEQGKIASYLTGTQHNRLSGQHRFPGISTFALGVLPTNT